MHTNVLDVIDVYYCKVYFHTKCKHSCFLGLNYDMCTLLVIGVSFKRLSRRNVKISGERKNNQYTGKCN